MTTFKVTMKPNERIYINGAVIKFDRKVSIEFLNDIQFLLESHVLQAEDAITPLKRLYFVIQLHLMDPNNNEEAMKLFNAQLRQLFSVFQDSFMLNELKDIDRKVKETRYHDAMKTLRSLYPVEQRLLSAAMEPVSFMQEEQPQRATAG